MTAGHMHTHKFYNNNLFTHKNSHGFYREKYTQIQNIHKINTSEVWKQCDFIKKEKYIFQWIM